MVTQRQALKYAGLLGHTWVVLRRGQLGWEMAAQCSTFTLAYNAAKAGEQIWQRFGKKWELYKKC